MYAFLRGFMVFGFQHISESFSDSRVSLYHISCLCRHVTADNKHTFYEMVQSTSVVWLFIWPLKCGIWISVSKNKTVLTGSVLCGSTKCTFHYLLKRLSQNHFKSEVCFLLLLCLCFLLSLRELMESNYRKMRKNH